MVIFAAICKTMSNKPARIMQTALRRADRRIIAGLSIIGVSLRLKTQL
jgi:hypothetical protein